MNSVAQPDLPLLPIERWLAPKELAGIWGLKEDSAERWVSEGIIPQKFVRYCGRWRIRIHPAVVPILERDFAAAHN